MNKNNRSKRPRRGAVIVLIALLLPAFLLIVGFSIDLAHIQLSRTEMRLAVDAAARAGAEELSRTQSLDSARNVAKDVAAMNPVAGNMLSLQNSDVDFGRGSVNQNGGWAFDASGAPKNAVRITGARNSAALDGKLNLLLGWYSNQSGVDLSVPAIAAFQINDIGLVLDRSTSMKQSITLDPGPSYDDRFCQPPLADSGWTALDSAVAVFINEIAATPAEERVSIVTFSSAIDPNVNCGALPAATLDQTVCNSIAALESTMQNLATTVWNGNTNIAAGIQTSHDDLLNGPSARSLADKFMLVMTDGMANEGDTLAAALDAADAGIKISTVTFGPGANQTAMQEVALIGGGVHYHANDAAELVEVFRKFAAQTALIIK